MIMLFFDHKWFSLQRMVYLFQVWLKVNFWSDPFTKVDNRLCIRQRVCFPSLSNTSTNRYPCKDPKENIESTYRQTVCFQWGHSEENISEKAKCMPSLDSRLNKQCPNNGPKVFSSMKSTWKSGQLNIMNFSPNNFVSSLFASFNFLFLWKEV